MSKETPKVVPSGFFVLSAPSTVHSVGRIGETSRLEIDAPIERRSRLDPDFVFALSHELGRDPAVRREIRFRPNPSLQRNEDLLVLIETRFQERTRSHLLVVLDASEPVDVLLRRATAGATLEELTHELLALLGSEGLRDHAESFVEELLDGQVLVPEIVPTLTGADPSTQWLEACREHPSLRAEGKRLQKTGPFQTDLIRPGPYAIGPVVVTELQRALALLNRLPRPPRKQSLDRFRDAFLDRYGEDREVPLTTVFDPESGLGFGPFPGQTALRSPTPDWLVDRVESALERGDAEIELDERELPKPAVEDSLPPLPDAFHVMAGVDASDPEALDRGDFRLWFQGLAGPSGARLLGHLCHADETLRRHVEAHLRQEEALNPEAIFAEIVHLPPGSPGNVPARPRLREYEIPLLARSSADESRQIPLDDLLLRVTEGRFVLRSARLDRRVLPRLSAADYFGGSPHAVYRFLGAVQSEGVLGGWSWDWGSLANRPVLPGVRCGRLVLARPRQRDSETGEPTEASFVHQLIVPFVRGTISSGSTG